MRREKSFPIISLVILFVFGTLCFLGGALTSNILNKRKVDAIQARLSECENKFLLFSRRVMDNIGLAVKISTGISNVWHSSINNGKDFNAAMEQFLAENKGLVSDMKLRHDLIEIQIAELKKYRKESNDTFDAVMELYDVYTKLYGLCMNPVGTIEGFDSNRKDLVETYSQAQAKLAAYIPELKKTAEENTDMDATASQAAPRQAREKKETKTPAVKAVRPLSSRTNQQVALTYDQRVKQVARDMTYRQVESALGVPREKNRDSHGNEAWIYPSEKAGFRNVVYFASGKVLQTKNLPLNSGLD